MRAYEFPRTRREIKCETRAGVQNWRNSSHAVITVTDSLEVGSLRIIAGMQRLLIVWKLFTRNGENNNNFCLDWIHQKILTLHGWDAIVLLSYT